MANFTLNNTATPLMPLPSHGRRLHLDAYHADCNGEEWIFPAVVGSYIFVERIQITVQGIAAEPTFSVGFGATATVTNLLSGPFQIALETTAAGYCPITQIELDYAKGRNMGRRGALSFGLVGDCSAAVPMHVLADIVIATQIP